MPFNAEGEGFENARRIDRADLLPNMSVLGDGQVPTGADACDLVMDMRGTDRSKTSTPITRHMRLTARTMPVGRMDRFPIRG
jgi:hypothetical protein